MAKYTNYTSGPRGITLADGSTRWLNPGESADIPKAEVVEPLPDLGAKAEAADDGAEIDALKAQVAALTKEVENGQAEMKALTGKLGDAEKANAALTKEVETLSKSK